MCSSLPWGALVSQSVWISKTPTITRLTMSTARADRQSPTLQAADSAANTQRVAHTGTFGQMADAICLAVHKKGQRRYGQSWILPDQRLIIPWQGKHTACGFTLGTLQCDPQDHCATATESWTTSCESMKTDVEFVCPYGGIRSTGVFLSSLAGAGKSLTGYCAA